MKKQVLVFGLIIGIILCINLYFMVEKFYSDVEFEGNDVLGYAAMVILFSLIFFGVRNYRNQELGGFISFGEAFKTGVLIVLVGTTVYVVVWLFYYYLFVPDFLDKYIPYALKDVPAAELAAKTAEMEDIRESYKNPLFVIVITYFEVFPVGLIVALVSALILKKKKQVLD